MGKGTSQDQGAGKGQVPDDDRFSARPVRANRISGSNEPVTFSVCRWSAGLVESGTGVPPVAEASRIGQTLGTGVPPVGGRNTGRETRATSKPVLQ